MGRQMERGRGREGESRTTSQAIAVKIKVMVAITAKEIRHPNDNTKIASGAEAIKPPRFPIATSKPFKAANSLGRNHSVITFKVGTKTPPTPNPISALLNQE
ncbi:MAG: hypothetical protein QXJ68_04985 [Methanocellales archaeon]